MAAMPALATCASSFDFTPLTPTAPITWPSFTIGTPPSQQAVHCGRRQECAAAVDDVFVDLALAATHGGRVLLGRCDVRGQRRRAVQALQPEQVARVVGDGDGHGPVVLEGLGFGGGGDSLDIGEFDE